MGIFSLASVGMECIFYGIIATCALMALIYAVIYLIGGGKNYLRSIPFLGIGILLSFLLCIQFSLMFGAFQAKEKLSAIEQIAAFWASTAQESQPIQNTAETLRKVKEEIPLVGLFIDNVDGVGNSTLAIANTLTTTIRATLNDYIWHRVWWILGMLVVALPLALCIGGNTIETKRRGTATSYNDYDYSSSSVSHPDDL